MGNAVNVKRNIRKIMPGWLVSIVRPPFRRLRHVINKPRIVSSQYDSHAPLNFTVGENKYGKYCVPTSSRERLASQKVLNGDIYEPDTIEYMREYCGDGDIIHAGAYFGDFLPALSSACTTGAIVWAFEPNHENYRCAAETLKLNNISNVVLTNAGLGERNGELLMLTEDSDGQSLGGRSMLIDPESNTLSGGADKVQIVAIDEVIPMDRRISILQIDVEGHEKQALEGALKTIKRCMPILIIEDYSGALFNTNWFKKHISSLGYEISHKLHNNTVLVRH